MCAHACVSECVHAYVSVCSVLVLLVRSGVVAVAAVNPETLPDRQK